MVQLELTEKEAVKLFSMCNATILSEEQVLNAAIHCDDTTRARIRKSMELTKTIKTKIYNACANRKD